MSEPHSLCLLTCMLTKLQVCLLCTYLEDLMFVFSNNTAPALILCSSYIRPHFGAAVIPLYKKAFQKCTVSDYVITSPLHFRDETITSCNI